MTLLSELRSTDYNDDSMYSYLCKLKYDEFVDSHEIEVDFLMMLIECYQDIS